MNVTPLPVGQRPPGYPSEFEQQVRLRDGRLVGVRPIVPADAPELGDAIKTADTDTLHRRFLGGRPPLTQELLEHLTTVDYERRFALAAFDPVTHRGVAIARYEQTGEGVAEVAVAVRPEWRRAGLATTLILMLAKAAVERGIHTFSASYFAENRPIAALVKDAGGAGTQLIHQGIAKFWVALDSQGGAAGDEAAGHEAAGHEAAGHEKAGDEKAGDEAAGRDQP